LSPLSSQREYEYIRTLDLYFLYAEKVTIMGKKVLKALGGIAVVLLGLAVIVWLVWIPSAREPGYVFVAAWGEPGNAPG